MQVASKYVNIGDEAMHQYLLGSPESAQHPCYIADILRFPDLAWITTLEVPEQTALYGSASGQTLPVVSFLTYPTVKKQTPNSYAFPYQDSAYGVFEHMLLADESPQFADPDCRYPLIILAHGAAAHGIYEIAHAHNLASQGYIVAVIFYGDERNINTDNLHDPRNSYSYAGFLRPLITQAVLDSILQSETFGPQVDLDNIGISGHSFGGFTSLALAGGKIQDQVGSVTEPRITAAVVAAPYVGHFNKDKEVFAFGTENSGLTSVTIPVLTLFGSKDESTLASFILPATEQLAGPTYVVELVDQPHIFEPGSWQDKENWEMLFFTAYLKHDQQALEKLRYGLSMKGGNEDIQRLEYQRQTGRIASTAI
ncbi:MAG: putative dienelactone hydrolase [Alphaproteobacteria bacterium]|jgi:predicted dienelactone hydrolase